MPENPMPKDLDLDVLVRLVQKAAQAYPAIHAIKLYESELESPRYILSVEVPGYEKLMTSVGEVSGEKKLVSELRGKLTEKADEEELCHVKGSLESSGNLTSQFNPDKIRVPKAEYEDLIDVMNDWQPERFPGIIEKIGGRLEEIYRPEYLKKMKALQDHEEDTRRRDLKNEWAKVSDDRWDIANEWMLLLGTLDEEPDGVMGLGWVLYKRPTTQSAWPDHILRDGATVFPQLIDLYRALQKYARPWPDTEEGQINLRKTAKDLVQECPDICPCISKTDLDDLSLYNVKTAEEVKATFIGRLLRRVVAKRNQGYQVSNYKEFYRAMLQIARANKTAP